MKTVYAIGIDFGTSNSCVTYATYYDRGTGQLDPDPVQRPEVISFDLQDTVPTVVFLGDGKEQQPQFGLKAEERAPYYPELTRSGFKLRLGHPEGGREAFLLSRQFMYFLRQRTAEVVPLDKKDPRVRFETIVGHPVQWSADQREETRRVAEEAGFPNVKLEEESMAALYSHLCDDRGGFQPRPGSRILMLDMGGGTTDFAFLHLAMQPDQRPVSIPVDPAPSVPAWGSGRRSYGGRDLDQLILDYLTRDWDESFVRRNRQPLLREVRYLKEEFSNRVRAGADAFETLWLIGEETRPIRLTRDEFETFADEYIRQLEVLVRGALAEANLAPRQVTHLILTGGHSRWYFVDRTLSEVFPHLSVENGGIRRHPKPEQSVARGAAYVPLVNANTAGVMAPVRKAAHALWVAIPNGSMAGVGGGWDEPILLVPKGQTLPFQSRSPIRIMVEQMDLSSDKATINIRFFSGQRRQALAERVAAFDRDFWERLGRKLSILAPWARAVAPDQFEVLVACRVDEHELITAELLVTRYVKGKAMETQRQKMKLNTAAG